MNTSWFETLETVLDSKTISPNYSLPHVICVLFEIYASGEGIGRYQLKDRVGLGEGSLRTLLKRLEKHGIISVKKKRAGHMLSAKGKKLVSIMLEVFSIPTLYDNPPAWLHNFGSEIHYSIINSNFITKPLSIGIEQRDAGMIYGGKGGACLLFNGDHLIFPGDEFKVSDILIKNSDLKKNDVVCFAGADNVPTSKIALIASILTLL